MTAKTILETANPITQSIDGVRALLTWRGHPTKPMPTDVSLDNGRLVLVLNGKKDAYYTCSKIACSCPAAHWNRGPCKHQRKYFPVAKAATKPTTSEPLIRRGGFRPIDTMPGEEKARAAPLYVDTTRDTTPREVAYHNIREDKIMWPVEA
jgi:hypothetical protein